MLEAELLSRAHSLALWGLGLTAGRLPWSCRVCQGAQLRAALEIFPFLETFADLEEKKNPSQLPLHCQATSAAQDQWLERSPTIIPPQRGDGEGSQAPYQAACFRHSLQEMGTNIFIRTTCQESDLMGTASQRPPLWIRIDPKTLDHCWCDPAAFSSLDHFS